MDIGPYIFSFSIYIPAFLDLENFTRAGIWILSFFNL
jgi:hypothetical protein